MNKTPAIVIITLVVLALIGYFAFWSPKSTTVEVPADTTQNTTNTKPDSNTPQAGTVSANLPTIFLATKGAFSIRLPLGYTADENFVNQITPTQKTTGAKFTIPKSLAAGTNLSSDTYLTVEQQSNTSACTPFEFTDLKTAPVSSITEGKVTYSAITMSNAGAGNRYETTIYAIPGTNPCTAIRYVVHYSALDNYPKGTVKEFNKVALLAQFDSIRQSLILK